MSDELKKLVQASIEKAKNWSSEGWTVTFGPRGYEVNSGPAADELPKTFPFREEAIGYWRNVESISEEVVLLLNKALDALEQGDLRSAGNQLYAAQYFEKPIEKYTQTSKPVYEAFQQA